MARNAAFDTQDPTAARSAPPPGRDAPAAAHATAGSPAAPDAAQERALDFVHTSALQHVVLADRKAGVLVTFLSAALVFLFTRMPAPVWPPAPAAALWLVTVALLVAAGALAFLVVLPRVRRDGPPGVLFWGTVAKHPRSADYLATMCAKSPDELARAKAAHCHQLSQICARKFHLLRWALLLAAAGLVLFLVALAVGLPPGPAVPAA
jgi:hypothetical protein